MPSTTEYLVLPFTRGPKGVLRAAEPIPARDPAHAERLLERMRGRRAGLVALKRQSNPEMGEFERPEIIGQTGQVPVGFEASLIG